MRGLGTVAAEFLLTYGLHGLAALAVLAAGSRLRRWSPRARDVAWKTAVLGTVLTAAWGTWVGRAAHGTEATAPWAEMTREVVLQGPGGATTRTRERVVLPAAAVRTPACRRVLGAWTTHGVDPAPRILRACAGLPAELPGAVGLIWLAGVILAAARLLARRGRIRGDLLPLAPLGAGRARVMLDRLLADRGGRRRVVLVTSRGLASPAVLARGVIGLPTGVEDAFQEPELGAVLAHELAHLERGDPTWSLVLDVLGVVFWFQPLLVVARREMREAAELLCDEWAAAWTGAPRALARALGRVAGWIEGAPPSPELAVVRRTGGRLEERVGRLLAQSPAPYRGRPPARAGVLFAALVLTVSGLAAAALPTVRLPRPPRVEVIHETSGPLPGPEERLLL